MWTDEQLDEVIRDSPAIVDDALQAISRTGKRVIDLTLTAAASAVLVSTSPPLRRSMLVARAPRDRFQ